MDGHRKGLFLDPVAHMDNTAHLTVGDNGASMIYQNHGTINNNFVTREKDTMMQRCLDALLVADPQEDRALFGIRARVLRLGQGTVLVL
jgi:hypothetical protein